MGEKKRRVRSLFLIWAAGGQPAVGLRLSAGCRINVSQVDILPPLPLSFQLLGLLDCVYTYIPADLLLGYNCVIVQGWLKLTSVSTKDGIPGRERRGTTKGKKAGRARR
ncbi:hypothetical protein F5Y05DRAFT_366276 [Hypoxylon sp. FL0543]|nr:hypothetical protein F5Y05DRAFT_366276 [Hypoxylon sp. FL0543]